MSISSFLNGVTAPLQAITAVVPASVAPQVEEVDATSPISLGDFHFTRFEVPESISTGVKQLLTVHTLIGGRRVIDAGGAEAMPVKWSGILLSADAEDRRDRLKAMAASGRSHVLTWGNTALDVVIESVSFDEKGATHIEYDINCIVQDTVVSQSAAGSSLQAAGSDLTAAVALPTPSGVSGIRDALTSTLRVAQQVKAGTAQVVTVWNGLNTAKRQIEGALADANSMVEAIGSIGQITENTSSVIKGLDDAAFAFERMAKLGSTGGYVGRAINNVRTTTGF